jgi:geranylgeranyl pyrophosphate synthase
VNEIAASADPALQAYATGRPGGLPYGDFVLDAIREGYELHYGSPRIFEGMDDDLRLLAGDALYALGLERLAQTGDLEAVAELADLISDCARAQAENRAHAAEERWAVSAEKLAPRA